MSAAHPAIWDSPAALFGDAYFGPGRWLGYAVFADTSVLCGGRSGWYVLLTGTAVGVSAQWALAL
jgi:hypothetical protein